MLARRADHGSRHAGQLGDLQAVALVRRTFVHGVQEHDAVAMLDRREMHVGRLRKFRGQLRQFEVVRGEQRVAAVVRQQMPGDGPREREAVEGRSAAADFVHQHEALRRRVVEDRGGFGHFDHERGAAAGQVVGGADAREDAIDRAERRAPRRHIAAHVSHQRDQRGLAHEGRFTAHVRAGDQEQLALGVQRAVVGDELLDLRLDDRMPSLFDFDAAHSPRTRARPSRAREPARRTPPADPVPRAPRRPAGNPR